MLRSAKALVAILSAAVLGAVLFAPSASAAMMPRVTPGTSPNFPVRVFYQQFNRPLKPHTWSIYQGRPACCKDSLWAKSHVLAKNGELRIRTYRDPAFGNAWVSGGVSMARILNQTYGRWVVRFRMRRGAGVGMDVALRPQGGGTVVDWIEESSDHGALRNLETATLHYGGTRIHAHVKANFTLWHTMTLSWIPGRITVKINGKIWADYRSHIPSAPMHLTMQTNTGTNGFTGVNPNSTTPALVPLQIDYVSVYRYR